MSIHANVAYVELSENGSGVLHLCDAKPEGSRGQDRLRFVCAPHEVTALNGLTIWGDSSTILLGHQHIATRDGYTRIVFVERDHFLSAVREYHERNRKSEEQP